MSGFPIVCGVCTLARVPGGFSCTLQPTNANASGTNAPTFDAGDVGAVYQGAVQPGGGLDGRFVHLASLVTSAAPPTAVGPDLVSAICAALVCYAVAILDRAMGPYGIDAVTVLANVNGALLATSRLLGGTALIGTTPPIPIPGLMIP